ncbi:uncharacterized protein N7469_002187 [Penicillium citrinum]|uniref:Uncharacterized protein n=1 Tax=Penicillium citrinum TaxID=5077 RepID=A0A9W9PAS6_PENCI|nr:uncharacterized protein N7469_002187 [Penicillium citrinum]KAJ5240596.1 hypothetical protein N7469_002187 [Penicillium citrinum]
MGNPRLEQDSKTSETTQPPPPYSALNENGIGDTSASLNDLSQVNSITSTNNVTAQESVAHLKLISAIASLRDSVRKTDNLFGICDNDARGFSEPRKQAQAASCVQEKRWAVYVARAVERFTTWWETTVPSPETIEISSPDTPETNVLWSVDMLPPLDIIMVWHSFMLNPRAFLEDCLRHRKMRFWATGLPWNIIIQSLNSSTYQFDPGEQARVNFEKMCGRPWNNLSESPMKSLLCLKCNEKLAAPWTEGSFGCDPGVAYAHCKGYADKSMRVSCPSCKHSITHDGLSVQAFRKDVQTLLIDGLPMPGTLLSMNGTPADDHTIDGVSFPNRLIKEAIRSEILQLTDRTLNEDNSIGLIRDYLESCLKDRSLIRRVNGKALTSRNSSTAERVSLRNMLSRYWDNPSVFSINLIGAVIRQGTFIDKAERIGWIRSPTLEATIGHFITKYGNFFQIISKNKGHAVVPTLDIDLVWHTHQLSPARYYRFSTSLTDGIFVDHDDKVDELKLNDAFMWTSLQYQKITGGELYSECTCWYCDAVRETHNRGFSRFISASVSSAKANATSLHEMKDSTSSKETSAPHISSHNAVRIQARTDPLAIENQNARLKSNLDKHSTRGSEVRDRRVLDGPYMRDSKIHPDIYPCNPVCVSTTLGSAGNCISGAEGIGMDRGACVSSTVEPQSRGRGKSFCAGIAGCGMNI